MNNLTAAHSNKHPDLIESRLLRCWSFNKVMSLSNSLATCQDSSRVEGRKENQNGLTKDSQETCRTGGINSSQFKREKYQSKCTRLPTFSNNEHKSEIA